MLNRITAGDYRIMRRANNWFAPRWVRWWMLGATRLGDGWIWYAVGVIILLFGGHERVHAFAAGAAASMLSIGFFQALKRMIGRKRPCEIEPHCWATVMPPDEFSFPSGHTMTAFAVTVAIALFFPSLSAALLFFAFSIAVSRVVLGMHFVSDVIAGMLLGAGLGLGSYLLFA
ncbi:MAG TPA: phosphatase PAP2 family protein [Bryobacteraceae bacterium]|nr:phosphatase PAP2 family protein [Bryobacteraceae bacterium]